MSVARIHLTHPLPTIPSQGCGEIGQGQHLWVVVVGGGVLPPQCPNSCCQWGCGKGLDGGEWGSWIREAFVAGGLGVNSHVGTPRAIYALAAYASPKNCGGTGPQKGLCRSNFCLFLPPVECQGGPGGLPLGIFKRPLHWTGRLLKLGQGSELPSRHPRANYTLGFSRNTSGVYVVESCRHQPSPPTPTAHHSQGVGRTATGSTTG